MQCSAIASATSRSLLSCDTHHSTKFYLWIVFPFVTDSIEADCLLPLPRLSFFAPLVYTPNGVLRTTEIGGISNEPTIRIPAGESMVLSCAPNHFKFQATTSVPATCKTGQTLSK